MFMETPKNPVDWHQVPLFITSSVALLVAAYKFFKHVIRKSKRFFDMPNTLENNRHLIEKFAKESDEKLVNSLDQVNNTLCLIDGRSKFILQVMMDVPFMEMDKHGLVDFVSPEAVRVIGRAKDECLGNGWLNAIYPLSNAADRGAVRDRWEIAIKRGDPFEEDVKVVNEIAGTVLVWRLKIAPVLNHLGEVLGWKLAMKPVPAKALYLGVEGGT